MSTASAMKQISSRNVGFKIELMEWSDKMDLIAISTDKGLSSNSQINFFLFFLKTPQISRRSNHLSFKLAKSLVPTTN